MKRTSEATSVDFFIKTHEQVIALLLGAMAVLRIFIYSAAFPFFNNVDEDAHFDTVVKYARGFLPRLGADYYDRESAELITSFKTPEFWIKPGGFSSGKFRLPHRLWPRGKMVVPAVQLTQQQINHEAFSPPVYYAIAGLWCRVGEALGIKGGMLLYW